VNRAAQARAATLAGYFALLALMLLWPTVFARSGQFPVLPVLLIAVGPLLIPLRGLLAGRPRTHFWAALLALLYFSHGVAEATAGVALGWLEIAFSLMLFFGATFYVRFSAAERSGTP
jgi:uncharacterized membrane protein